jgi:hypothetical protein
MSGNPWTPGPWFAQPGFLTIYNMSDGTSGLTCAVASVLVDQPGIEQANANARLIAAAPEMAEALEECANRLKRAAIHLGSDEEFAEAAVAKYRALLARIRGDAP